MQGLQTLADINVPKSRCDTTSSGEFDYYGIAKTVSTQTNEIGWAIYRANKVTGDVDWAQSNGVESNDYLFRWDERTGLTYGED